MLSNQKIERVLLVTRDNASLKPIFTQAGFEFCNFVWADSFAGALLVQQSNPCHVVLIDESSLLSEGFDGLLWLLHQQDAPLVLMGDLPDHTVDQAYNAGIRMWFPRSMCLQHPLVLTGALREVGRLNNVLSASSQQRQALSDCHKQVDRLVSLLWRTGQLEIERRWYNYRLMLERLEEEVNRSQRYQVPLTVALGEMQFDEPVVVSEEEWITQTAEHLYPVRRRSDVVGQYGLTGFMIVMSHTPGEGGVRCCQRLKTQLKEPGEQATGLTNVYFGLSSLSNEVSSPQSILRLAEEHLLSAKKGVNDGIVFA